VGSIGNSKRPYSTRSLFDFYYKYENSPKKVLPSSAIRLNPGLRARECLLRAILEHKAPEISRTSPHRGKDGYEGYSAEVSAASRIC
jgi:hypothetical protein